MFMLRTVSIDDNDRDAFQLLNLSKVIPVHIVLPWQEYITAQCCCIRSTASVCLLLAVARTNDSYGASNSDHETIIWQRFRH